MPCKIVGGTKVPGNEKFWERKFPRTKGPGNESSRERKVSGTKVPHRDYSFLGMNGLGHEKTRYPVLVSCTDKASTYWWVTGHFAYQTLRLLDTLPTTWTLRLLDISPTR